MRYVLKAEIIIDAANDMAAIASLQKTELALKNKFVAQYLHGQGVRLVEVKVDPKPTPA